MNDQPQGGNPFEGNPFSAWLQALGGGQGFDLGKLDLNSLMAQVQAMMAPHDGAVNWTIATDLARRATAQQPDPTPDRSDQARIADAFRLADHWLDETTVLPSGVTTPAAWSRADWIESTTPVWKILVEPIAEHVVAAMGEAMKSAMPAEAAQMAAPIMGLLGQAGSAMFASQIGQAIGGLASEVVTSSDVGLPLGPTGTAALVAHNVTEFADGLGIEQHDVELYLALREAAHQRLFAHVPWLRQHLISSVEDFGRGVTIDVTAIEESMRSLDPTDPAAIQEALSGGLFEPKPSPAQQAALQKLETTLALIEGWVDEVVGLAASSRMPAAGALQEAIRRRRAAGGPAEQTFASLVGLELRPRRLRDAATLWGSLRSRQGIEARDAVWAHPDLLPTAADLDDPLGFREDITDEPLSDEDFDRELGKLLGGDTDA